MNNAIYVAGPYTTGSESANVERAVRAADQLMGRGYEPFVPHLSHFWQMIGREKDYERWMDWCLTWVRRCDRLVRIAGDSPGGDREVLLAERLGMPVYYGVGRVPVWREK